MADNTPIDVSSLGQTGVVIDLDPLDPSLPDNSFQFVQNGMPDVSASALRALRKRPGQQQFANAFMGGAILGGIPMAVAGTGGAPASGGGGGTGDPTGGGPGTGAPGAPYTPSGGSGSGSGGGVAGASAFGGTAPLIIVGEDTNNSANGHGFILYPTGGGVNSTDTTTPIVPGAPGNTGFSTGLKGRPSCFTDDGWFYFAQTKDTDATAGTSQAIYRTNGAVTQLVATISPFDGVNNKYPVASAMAYDSTNKKVYVAIRDTLYNVTTSPSPQSRLIQIDHTTLLAGSVATIANVTIMKMLWSTTVGRLFIVTCQQFQQSGTGTYPLYSYSAGSGLLTCNTYVSNPYGMAMVEVGSPVVAIRIGTLRDGVAGSMLPQLQGVNLQAGTADGTDGASTNRTFGNSPANGFAGHYPVAFNGSETQANYAGIYSALFFNNAVIYSWFNTGTKAALVRETIPGTDWTAGGTYTDVWTDGGLGGNQMPFELVNFGGVAYAFGTTGITGNNKVLKSADGITWVDISSNFNAGLPATGAYLPGVNWHIDS